MTGKTIEKIVEELALQVPFKDAPGEGDVMLVVEEDGLECRILFGQVTRLESEIIDGAEWLRLELVFLTLPLSYGKMLASRRSLAGFDIFEEAGKKIFVKAVNTRGLFDFFSAAPEAGEGQDRFWPAPPAGPEGPDPPETPPGRPKSVLRLVK
jgi:hypothetical protein